MQERYSEEVKSILEAAQQQAVMNYQQELSCAHILVALSSSEGFFRFLLANVKADERNFAQEAKALMQRIPSVKGQDRQLVMSTALARVLGLAAQAAGQGEVNVGNLVAALAGDGDSETVSLLKKYGIDKKKVEGLYMAYTNGQADEESKHPGRARPPVPAPIRPPRKCGTAWSPAGPGSHSGRGRTCRLPCPACTRLRSPGPPRHSTTAWETHPGRNFPGGSKWPAPVRWGGNCRRLRRRRSPCRDSASRGLCIRRTAPRQGSRPGYIFC